MSARNPLLGDLRDYVVRPVLDFLDPADPGQAGPVAERLILGTVAVESDGRWLEQPGPGPARSLLQIEPATHADVIDRWLIPRKPGLYGRIMAIKGEWPPDRHDHLYVNIAYAVAIARQIYRRRPEALPAAGDLDGLAAYWKAHYNTALGAGTPGKFKVAWHAHCAALYPEG